MAMEYTEEQLNNFDKAMLAQLFLAQQSQLRDIDQKLQLLLKQIAVLNNKTQRQESQRKAGCRYPRTSGYSCRTPDDRGRTYL